ncbi:MAG: GNAT family N-acetyltransferase [Trueperaceae bacterium]
MIRIVQIEQRFAEDLERLQRDCFPNLAEHELMTRENFISHCRIFPEGDFVALDVSERSPVDGQTADGQTADGQTADGQTADEQPAGHPGNSVPTNAGAAERVVGLGSGFFTEFDFDHPDHTFEEVIAGGDYSNHDPDGDWYYGGDISVHPDYRRRGIGRMLYDARKDLVRRFNRRGIVAGGALPGYAEQRDSLTVPDYVRKVVGGGLNDPTLSFQLRNGFRVRGMLRDYIEDSVTGNWATLIAWENPAYRASQGVGARR